MAKKIKTITANPLPKYLTGTPCQAVRERAKNLDEIYDRLSRDVKILDTFNEPSNAAYPPEKIAEALSDRMRDMRDKGEIPSTPESPSPKEKNLRVWLDWLQQIKTEVDKGNISGTKEQQKKTGKKIKTKGKVGRPKVSIKEAQKRCKIKSDWEQYRDTIRGANKKKNFCYDYEDEDITVEYLNNSVLRWCRDHPK